MHCKRLHLSVGGTAYDDDISYWAAMSEAELQEVQSLRETFELFQFAKRLIEAASVHAISFGYGKFYIRDTRATVLAGRPRW